MIFLNCYSNKIGTSSFEFKRILDGCFVFSPSILQFWIKYLGVVFMILLQQQMTKIYKTMHHFPYLAQLLQQIQHNEVQIHNNSFWELNDKFVFLLMKSEPWCPSLPSSCLLAGLAYMAFRGKPGSPGMGKAVMPRVYISFSPWPLELHFRHKSTRLDP